MVLFFTVRHTSAGIICVGAKLSATEVLAVGLQGVPAVVATVAVSATLLPWLGRKAGLAPKLSSVITIGTTICGVTAISALAPAIQASQKQMSFAIANVVAFGTVNMLLMPHFAHWMFTSSEQVGLFLGLAVHDTAQVGGPRTIVAESSLLLPMMGLSYFHFLMSGGGVGADVQDHV